MTLEAFPRRATAALIGAVLAFATLAGCGSGEPTAAPPTPSLPERAPDPAERCGFAGAVEKLVLTTADGVKLAAARIGSGPHGVVLLHQAGSDMCGWNPTASTLAEAGFNVMVIDLRCAGYSDCDHDQDDPDWQDGTHDFAADGAAAIAALKKAGASKVAVMGASLGAVTAVVTAGRFADQISAVVALSVFNDRFNASGSATTDVNTPADAAKHITSPMLIGISVGDPGSLTAADAQFLVADSPAKAAAKIIVRDGSAHGWDMLRNTDVYNEVTAFLKTNT